MTDDRKQGSPFVSRIEHLLDWAEPTIQQVCQDVWRETSPTGLELVDLHQEGRVAVLEAADAIAAAHRPQAMVATVVRRQAYDAVRVLSERDPRSKRTESPAEAVAAG